MKHYILFAGTTEGRILTEYILQLPVKLTVCTATEYGKQMLPQHPNLTVFAGRMEQMEMADLFRKEIADAILDATHPYATLVTQNIQVAAKVCQIPYYRILRPEQEIEQEEHLVFCDSLDQAVQYLSHTAGNILSTIGSKELAKLCAIPHFSDRIYARILPQPEMVKKCYDLGFQGKHLICMQGPFSCELNTALLHQLKISYTLTKNTGDAGGFLEKVHSAQETQTTLVIIGRPIKDEAGYTLEEIKRLLHEAL